MALGGMRSCVSIHPYEQTEVHAPGAVTPSILCRPVPRLDPGRWPTSPFVILRKRVCREMRLRRTRATAASTPHRTSRMRMHMHMHMLQHHV